MTIGVRFGLEFLGRQHGEDGHSKGPSPHHPLGFPLFCSSSHFFNGAK